MTRTEFENLKENDCMRDSEGTYVVTGWYNNQLVEFKELVYNEEKEDFDITNNEFRCCYNDLKKAYIE